MIITGIYVATTFFFTKTKKYMYIRSKNILIYLPAQFASVGVALLAIMVTPVPGITEFWLASSAKLMFENDENAGKHMILDHPEPFDLAAIFSRFRTAPSLQADVEFVQDWQKLADLAGNESSKDARDKRKKMLNIPVGSIADKACLVHNGTARAVTMALCTAETDATQNSVFGKLKTTFKRHPISRMTPDISRDDF